MLRVSLWLCAFASVTGFCAEAPSGDSVIRGAAGGSEIVISTTARLAGAIDSLSWNGKEFINSTDHGRQLQSASNLDNGTPILNETYNPTEAGCERDGAGPVSSSRLLHLVTTGNALQTTSQMAFWLRPGGKSGGQLAKNNTVLSNHLLTKRVRIGYKEMPGVISYDVTFGLPIGERHNEAVFEALTGYMPAEFSRFLQFNAQSGELEPLSEGPGEIAPPVVLSVPGGSHAMGIYSPPQNSPGTSGPTYGRFNFNSAKVVKWNCVFRIREKDGIAPGDYPFRMFVIVGDLATVTGSLRALHREFGFH
ncbi:MAG: hypothetical protein JWL90_2751 [Chthoniobacteraceae bacterium]|nr:hypothetical protein [Chthoniobacteraceae bacterium]